MLALVSCELNRLSLGLRPSRPDEDTIASGRFVCELNVDAIELVLSRLGGGPGAAAAAALALPVRFMLWPIFARKKMGFCLNALAAPFLVSCWACFCCCWGVTIGMCGLDSISQLARWRCRSNSTLARCMSASFRASAILIGSDFLLLIADHVRCILSSNSGSSNRDTTKLLPVDDQCMISQTCSRPKYPIAGVSA
uniref:(northern house mosquito) hypothetical protein n=1 Tax=Culex pipiens TaxID=7175 RepID=A0A8D8GWZ9_CULPI